MMKAAKRGELRNDFEAMREAVVGTSEPSADDAYVAAVLVLADRIGGIERRLSQISGILQDLHSAMKLTGK